MPNLLRVLAPLLSTLLLAASPPHSVVRLPADVRPIRYDAHLTVNPAEPVFEGTIAIDVRLARAATVIWLNGTDLEVLDARARVGKAWHVAKVSPVADEFVGLAFEAPLPAGVARLTLRYRGTVRDDSSAGAFRRKSPGGDWYVYTTFTAIDARRVFPCFDQPDYKTPWRLTLTVPEGDVALANTAPAQEMAATGGRKTVVFAETKPLPSELVAFAVGPFDLWDAGKTGSQGTAMRVAAPRGRGAEGKLAGELARTILPRLEEYTATPYAFGKLDHMALLQGAYGGVENPGLIQYLGRLLLVSEEEAAARRQELEGLMAHEMAHQWFGNLVTQRTWRDVWLSEGLTTWMGNKIADMSLPAAEQGLRMAGARESAMRTDASHNARAVRLDLPTREAMKKVYGGAVYSKGGSFVSMLEGWLGEGAVQRAVRRYLHEHPYGNATTAGFVRAVRVETGRDITRIAAAALDREGVPIVSATLSCEGGGQPRLMLKQSRYVVAGRTAPGGAWTLPVCARTEYGTDCTVLSAPSGELALTSAKACPGWVMPNASGRGYYRVNLPAASLRHLAAARDKLSPVERLTLVEEMQAMVRAGLLPAGEALPLLAGFGGNPETEKAAREAVRFIGQFVPEELREAYREYAKRTFGEGEQEKPGDDDSLRALREIHAASLRQLLKRL